MNFSNLSFNIVHNPKNVNYQCKINLVAHVHDKWKVKRYYNINKKLSTVCINIGVDVWGFKPVSHEEILKVYYRYLKRYGQGKIINKNKR